MNKIIFLVMSIFTVANTTAQSINKTYLLKGASEDASYCYQVVELTIHDDATFTNIAFACGDKKKWKNYKNWKAKIKNGSVTRNGDYYILTEYRNGFKTEFSWTVKITDKNVFYYYPNKNNKLKKSAKYKRIKLEDRY